MKAVMLSIQPKWIELIASGKKTVEVRKTKPKIDVPFKCYIYATKGEALWKIRKRPILIVPTYDNRQYVTENEYYSVDEVQGKVIGEFVCDKVDVFTYFENCVTPQMVNVGIEGCLTLDELAKYFKRSSDGYAWHITDLVIYEHPKELSEFYVEGDCDCMNCRNCAWFDMGNGYNVEDDCNLAYKGADEHKSYKPIKRPPQSWCYCEELKGETK